MLIPSICVLLCVGFWFAGCLGVCFGGHASNGNGYNLGATWPSDCNAVERTYPLVNVYISMENHHF